jgi:hypothetical protein
VSLVALVIVFTAISSISFSPRAHAQRETVEETPAVVSPSLEVAVVAGAFAAYGWAANKFYDLGKEVGRAHAQSGGLGKNLVHLDQRHDSLLD